MKQFILRNSAPIVTIILTCLLLTGAGQAFAQRNERIHAIKVGYLTDRLKLSTEQATAFWPVYEAYETETRATRRQFRQSQQQQPKSDEQATRLIDDNLEYQEAILTINKRYRDRFLKVISPTQLATLYDAERDFRKLLLQQLKERREK